MNLTDEELDALAGRLWRAGTACDTFGDPWDAAAREAARWAEEQQGEVVWEWWNYGEQQWLADGFEETRLAEADGHPVRAIRVIATTTKEPSHE